MADLKQQVEAAVMARSGKQYGNRIRFQCPAHVDEHPSADYDIAKHVWICRVCGESGNYWHLARLLNIVPETQRKNGYKETRRWDVGGIATHRRWEKPGATKAVEWEKGGKSSLSGTRIDELPLYAAELILVPTDPVLLSEGEKATDALLALGLQAVGTVGGALSTPSIRSLSPLANHPGKIFLCQDNDQPGHHHVENIAARLKRMGKDSYILDWPGVPDKGDAYDFIHAGADAAAVQAVLDSAQLFVGAAESGPVQVQDLPDIKVNDREPKDLTYEALAALYQSNRPPIIFCRSGSLVRILLDEKKRPFIALMTESALRGYLLRAADFYRTTDKSGDTPVWPPIEVVRDILSLGKLDFPPLIGLTESPVIRPSGSIMSETGYDWETCLFYCPDATLVVPAVPDNPTTTEIKEAVRLIMEPICDFPFDGPASLANALATMITPILRPMINGPVPLAIIDKPQAGTGASLLAETISLIATGHPAAMMTAQKDDEGWRKSITSLLIKGQLVITIDNVENDLMTPSLAAILTSNTFQDRILGKSEMITLPNRATWIATGNNIRLRGDLPRRCIWIRMDAKQARPWQRELKIFQHPDLAKWVTDNRGNILAAILTIARAWSLAGQPGSPTPNLGSFEDYTRVIGGVLNFIGVEGFLANLSTMYDEADSETPQWENFTDAWRESLEDRSLTVVELLDNLNSNQTLRQALPDNLADMSTKNYMRRFGKALSKNKDVRLPNGLSIVKDGEHGHAIKWKVIELEKVEHQISFPDQAEAELEPALVPAYLKSEPRFKLSMPVADAIEIWKSRGAPVIHLSHGVNCLDLEKYLRTASDEQLEAIQKWLEKER